MGWHGLAWVGYGWLWLACVRFLLWSSTIIRAIQTSSGILYSGLGVYFCCFVLQLCLQGFSTIWAAKDLQCPPGHTPYSWEKAGDKTFKEL